MRLLLLFCVASIANSLFVTPMSAQQSGTTSSTSGVNRVGAYVSGQAGGSPAPALSATRPILRRTQPVLGQPYSLLETTTWEHLRPDGTRSTNTSQRRMMRDADGRTRTEMGTGGLAGSGTVTVDDPVLFTVTNINPVSRTATVAIYNRTPPLTPEEEEQRKASLAKARLKDGPAPVVEKLPATIIEGVAAEGIRNTRIIPSGCMGNNSGSDIQVVTETWTSPELKIVLRSSSDNPQTGKILREVTELKRDAPDPALFQVPEGYKVIERERRAVPPDLAVGLSTGSSAGLAVPQPCRTGLQ